MLLKVLERGRNAQDKLAEQREQEFPEDFHHLPAERSDVVAAANDDNDNTTTTTTGDTSTLQAPSSTTLPIKASPLGGELASPRRPPVLQADADETSEFGGLSSAGEASVRVNDRAS